MVIPSHIHNKILLTTTNNQIKLDDQPLANPKKQNNETL